MLQVKDGSRILQFDGSLLASSSSYRPNSERWVEFKLYRTETGSYVMSRIGRSILYHTPQCEVAVRNYLRETPRARVDADYAPCPLCAPDADPSFPLVCPEKPRFKAWVCDGPSAVLDSLYRYDSAGSRYLTLVSERLLNEAADADDGVARAYRVETIQ